LEKILSQTVKQYLREDDVFCEEFLENILISFDGKDESTTGVPTELFKALGAKTVSTVDFANPSTLRPGPYFLENGGISQAWRRYTDPLAAFVRPIIPSISGGKFEDPGIPLYPVPSRLFSEPKSQSKPLSGLRFAVKDVIDLAGVVTTNCCRAYEELYGVAKKTAPAIQKLIDLGARPVAKARTVQFASGSHPMDWIEVQIPLGASLCLPLLAGYMVSDPPRAFRICLA
jgi:hypothetical protein